MIQPCEYPLSGQLFNLKKIATITKALPQRKGIGGRRITAIMAAFQAADAGPTPAVRTKTFHA